MPRRLLRSACLGASVSLAHDLDPAPYLEVLLLLALLRVRLGATALGIAVA